jgi:Zn-dependent protease
MSLELMLIRIPAILIAITIHEVAHGLIALRCGDTTARDAGRLTLNPIAHLDIFGALMMFFGPFGWAKPVPINPARFNNRRRDLVFVSVAGPVSNVLCAVICGLIIRLIISFNIPVLSDVYVLTFLQLCFLLNIGLSFFNLIPVPPLDGSNMVMGMLPPSKLPVYFKYMQHAPKVLLGMLLLEWALKIPVFSFVFDPIFNPYLNFWQWLVFGRKVIGL